MTSNSLTKDFLDAISENCHHTKLHVELIRAKKDHKEYQEISCLWKKKVTQSFVQSEIQSYFNKFTKGGMIFLKINIIYSNKIMNFLDKSK